MYTLHDTPLLLMRLLLHAVGAYMDWTWIALQCVVMSCVCAKTARGTRTWPTANRPRQDACVHSGSTGLQVCSSIADNHPASYRSSQQVSYGRDFASQMFPMDDHCTAGWQGIDTFKALQYKHTNAYNSCIHNTPMATHSLNMQRSIERSADLQNAHVMHIMQLELLTTVQPLSRYYCTCTHREACYVESESRSHSH